MVQHLAALTGRATEPPHTSAHVGVCRYYLLSLSHWYGSTSNLPC